MKKCKNEFLKAACFLAAFMLWTALVCLVDIKPIGPQGTLVGLSTINYFFQSLIGVNMSLYTITDWLSIIPLGFVLGFAILGLIQWLKRKNILNVDYSILILGAFYIIVFFVYFLFEFITVNYRPVLINGNLEASYPSSTTMLVLCVMPTAGMQLNARIKNKTLKNSLYVIIWVFTTFMIIARLLSGVHWFSDIIGGTLLSLELIKLYSALSFTY